MFCFSFCVIDYRKTIDCFPKTIGCLDSPKPWINRLYNRLIANHYPISYEMTVFTFLCSFLASFDHHSKNFYIFPSVTKLFIYNIFSRLVLLLVRWHTSYTHFFFPSPHVYRSSELCERFQ